MEKEIRAFETQINIETRADGSEDFIVEAIVYNQLSQLLGGSFREQIDPSALDNCDMTDVVGLFNHDRNYLLGRTTAGTLTLEKHEGGLRYKMAVDKSDPDHMKVLAKIKRGDVTGSSFGFVVAPGGADWDRDMTTGTDIRTVKRIGLLDDVSLVVSPAYLQSSAGMSKRNVEALHAERDAMLQERAATIAAEPTPAELPVDAEVPAVLPTPADWQVQQQHLLLQSNRPTKN